MPYDLKELAAISGMSGLYRLVRPARHGVLVETLDERATRSLAPASNKVSLLSEIGIYTQQTDETVPLTDVFERIYQQHGTDLPVTAKSADAELSDFLAGVLPDYDRKRVYLSDIKKLVTWYGIVSKHRPYEAPAAPEEAPAETATATEDVSAATEAPAETSTKGKKKAAAANAGGESPASASAETAKPKRKPAAKKSHEPAPGEPLSTGGTIPEADPAPQALGDPEVTTEAAPAAKKSRGKKSE